MSQAETVTGPARHIHKVTYTPVSLASGQEAHGDVLVRGSFLRLLDITANDASQMELSAAEKQSALALADHRAAASDREYTDSLQRVAKVPAAHLDVIAEQLTGLRDGKASSLAAEVRKIDQQYQTSLKGQTTPLSSASVKRRPTDRQSAMSAAVSGRSDLGGPPSKVVEGPTTIATTIRPPVSYEIAKVFVAPALVKAKLGGGVTARLNDSIGWAAANAPDSLTHLIEDFSIDTAGPADLPGAISARLLDYIQKTIIAGRVAEIVTSGLFDLVGLLHLERMVMTPLEMQRGELLYSLPLAPEETVTLAHKEWTIVQEDFSRYIQDYLENYSETGVAQSSELSNTTDTQLRRQDATSANLSSMSNQAVSTTAPVSTFVASSTVDASTSMEQSVSEMREVTSKASTRTIRDQKISFTVTTVKGSEDWTARLLKNSHADKSMIVDYYRRVRRWRTDLYRHGVRLTYDVIVPHPGRRLWEIYQKVSDIQKQLAQGFQMPLDVFSIDRFNWPSLASSYHVALPAPAPDLVVEEPRTMNYPEPGFHTEDIQLGIPANYRIQSLSFEINVGVYDSGDRGSAMLIGPNVWSYISPSAKYVETGTIAVPLTNIPLQGPVKAVLVNQNIAWGTARIFATATPTDEAMNSWRQTCWNILREAALARFQQEQDRLRMALAGLQRAINAADTLSLRRIEREYVMLACLEWLFPFLNLQSGWFAGVSDTPTELDRVAGFGESVLIKLMHTGIDWDSMLITLLPFFWEQIGTDARVFVDHADPLHREFLRAGAARVVLPIRPGYEEQIVSLFDLGFVGGPAGGNRYQKVIDDVHTANAAFDAVSHPGAAIGPDGAILASYKDDYPLETGKLIGRWHDILPTGALDMDVTFQKVSNA